MKKELLVCGIGTALITLCGCSPELAQSNYGSEEAQWARGIENSYPGYRPPHIAPPAIVDNVSPRLVEAEEEKAANVEAIETAAPAPAESNAVKAVPPAQDDVVPAETIAAPAADPVTAPAPAVNAPAPANTVKADAAKVEAPAPENLEFTMYTVKAGDSLTKIAKEQYGDARKYDIIVKANGITDPTKVRVGMKLQIPKL